MITTFKYDMQHQQLYDKHMYTQIPYHTFKQLVSYSFIGKGLPDL